MLLRKKSVRKLLLGMIGLCLVVAIAACSAPDAKTSSISGASSTTRAFSLPTESPLTSTSQNPAAADSSDSSTSLTFSNGTVGETVSQISTFKLLDRLLKTTGLEETLNQPGPYTLFAPTNDAFADLPSGTLEKLLRPDNKDKLKQTLMYHMVLDDLISSHIKSGQINTLAGKSIKITSDAGKITVDESKTVKSEITTKNGVIYAIDQVLLLPGLSL